MADTSASQLLDAFAALPGGAAALAAIKAAVEGAAAIAEADRDLIITEAADTLLQLIEATPADEPALLVYAAASPETLISPLVRSLGARRLAFIAREVEAIKGLVGPAQERLPTLTLSPEQTAAVQGAIAAAHRLVEMGTAPFQGRDGAWLYALAERVSRIRDLLYLTVYDRKLAPAPAGAGDAVAVARRQRAAAGRSTASGAARTAAPGATALPASGVDSAPLGADAEAAPWGSRAASLQGNDPDNLDGYLRHLDVMREVLGAFADWRATYKPTDLTGTTEPVEWARYISDTAARGDLDTAWPPPPGTLLGDYDDPVEGARAWTAAWTAYSHTPPCIQVRDPQALRLDAFLDAWMLQVSDADADPDWRDAGGRGARAALVHTLINSRAVAARGGRLVLGDTYYGGMVGKKIEELTPALERAEAAALTLLDAELEQHRAAVYATEDAVLMATGRETQALHALRDAQAQDADSDVLDGLRAAATAAQEAVAAITVQHKDAKHALGVATTFRDEVQAALSPEEDAPLAAGGVLWHGHLGSDLYDQVVLACAPQPDVQAELVAAWTQYAALVALVSDAGLGWDAWAASALLSDPAITDADFTDALNVAFSLNGYDRPARVPPIAGNSPASNFGDAASELDTRVLDPDTLLPTTKIAKSLDARGRERAKELMQELNPDARYRTWAPARDSGYYTVGVRDLSGKTWPLPWALMGSRTGASNDIRTLLGISDQVDVAVKLRNDAVGRIYVKPRTLDTLQRGLKYPDTCHYTVGYNTNGIFQRQGGSVSAGLKPRTARTKEPPGTGARLSQQEYTALLQALSRWKLTPSYITHTEQDPDGTVAVVVQTPWWLSEIPADYADLGDDHLTIRPGALRVKNPWYVEAMAAEAQRLLSDPAARARGRDRAIQVACESVRGMVLAALDEGAQRATLRRAVLMRANATPWDAVLAGDESQIPLVRRPPLTAKGAMIPDLHQNEATRLVARADEGVVIAFDVGVGKTMTAVQTAAYLRQQGSARCAVVVVPNPLVVQWIQTIKRVLPDYRVGIVGVVPDKVDPETRRTKMLASVNPLTQRPFTELEVAAALRVGAFVAMPAAQRVEVWRAVARGAYDIVLCTETAFTQAGVDPAMVQEAVTTDAGLSRWATRLLSPVSSWSAWTNFAKRHAAGLLKTPSGGTYTPDYDGFKLYLQDRANRLLTEGAPAKIENARLVKILLTKPFDTDTTVLPEEVEALMDEHDLKVVEINPVESRIVAAGNPHRPLDGKVVDAMLERPPVLDPVWIGAAPGRDVPDGIVAVPVDLLVLDEAHRYKGLFTAAKRGYLRGGTVEALHSSAEGDDGSRRALRMFGRARVVQHCGGRVVSLTATPAKVSPIELYTAIALAAPGVLRAMGVDDPERFLSMFLRFGATLLAEASGNIVYTNYVVAPDRDLPFLQDLMKLTVMVRNVNDVPRLSKKIADGADGTTIRRETDVDTGTSRLRAPSMPVESLRELAETTRLYLHIPVGNVAGNYTITEYHDGADGEPRGVTTAPPFAVDQPQVDWQVRDAATMPISPPIIRDVVHLPPVQRGLYDAVAENYADAIADGRSLGYAAVPGMINLAMHPALAAFAVAGHGAGASAARFTLALAAPTAVGVEDEDEDEDAKGAATDADDEASEDDADDDFGIAGGRVLGGQTTNAEQARGWRTMLSRCLRPGEPKPAGVKVALDEIDPAQSPKLRRCAENLLADLEAATPVQADGPACGHIVFADGVEVHAMLYVLLTRMIRARRAELEAQYRKEGLSGAQILDRLYHLDPQRVAVLNGPTTTPASRQVIAEAFNGVYDVDANSQITTVAPSAYDVLIANRIAYEGLDLQRRTCTIHHLDLPWEPASFIQRNGRGVRQGNLSPIVQIIVYLADGTLDYYRLRRVEGRRGWFAGIVSGSANASRTIDASREAQIDAVLAAVPPKDRAEHRVTLETKFALVAQEEAAADSAAVIANLNEYRRILLDRWGDRIGSDAAASRLRQLRILLNDLINSGNLPAHAEWVRTTLDTYQRVKTADTPMLPLPPWLHQSIGVNAVNLPAAKTPLQPGRIYLALCTPAGNLQAGMGELTTARLVTPLAGAQIRELHAPLIEWHNARSRFVTLSLAEARTIAQYLDVTDTVQGVQDPVVWQPVVRALNQAWIDAWGHGITGLLTVTVGKAALAMHTLLTGQASTDVRRQVDVSYNIDGLYRLPSWYGALLLGLKGLFVPYLRDDNVLISRLDAGQTIGGTSEYGVADSVRAARAEQRTAFGRKIQTWQQREANRRAYVNALAAWQTEVDALAQKDELDQLRHDALVGQLESAHAKATLAANAAGEPLPAAPVLPPAPMKRPKPPKPPKPKWLRGDPTLPLPEPQLVFPPDAVLRQHTAERIPLTAEGRARLTQLQRDAQAGNGVRSGLTGEALASFGILPALRAVGFNTVPAALERTSAEIRAFVKAQSQNIAVQPAEADEVDEAEATESVPAATDAGAASASAGAPPTAAD